MIADHPEGRPALLPALAAMTWLQALVALALFAPGAVAPAANLDVSRLSIFSTAVFAVGVFTTFWSGGLITRIESLRMASLCAVAVAASMAFAALGSSSSLLVAGLCLGFAFGPETPAALVLKVMKKWWSPGRPLVAARFRAARTTPRSASCCSASYPIRSLGRSLDIASQG